MYFFVRVFRVLRLRFIYDFTGNINEHGAIGLKREKSRRIRWKAVLNFLSARLPRTSSLEECFLHRAMASSTVSFISRNSILFWHNLHWFSPSRFSEGVVGGLTEERRSSLGKDGTRQAQNSFPDENHDVPYCRQNASQAEDCS